MIFIRRFVMQSQNAVLMELCTSIFAFCIVSDILEQHFNESLLEERFPQAIQRQILRLVPIKKRLPRNYWHTSV